MKNKIKLLDDLIQKSYSPYSECKVACLLEFENRALIGGVNVENASYGLSMCAERNAIFSSVALGYDVKKIAKIFIKTNKNSFFTPCGACLQVMGEFVKPSVEVTIINCNNEIRAYTFGELLPVVFNKEKLN